MVVADLAAAEAIRGAERRWIGGSIRPGVVVGRIARIAGHEHRPGDAGLDQLGNVAEDVFGAIVLIVAIGVVDRIEVLISKRHLPQIQRFVGVGGDGAVEVLLPAREVRKGDVEPVPEPILAVHVLVLASVAIERVIEEHVVRADLAQKGTHLLAQRGAIGRGAGIQTDVVTCRPGAHVIAKNNVRRVHIAQVSQRLSKAGVGVRVGRHVREPRAGDRRLQQIGIVALARAEAEARAVDVVGGLDGVPTRKIRLDIDQRGLAEPGNAVIRAGTEPLHQQGEVGVIRLHQTRRIQVGDVLLPFTTRPAGSTALQQLVVGKHRDVAVLGGFIGIVERERTVCIPRLPAGAGVHTAYQVLEAEIPWDAALRHPRIASTGTDTQAEVRRQTGGQGVGGRGAQWEDQGHFEDQRGKEAERCAPARQAGSVLTKHASYQDYGPPGPLNRVTRLAIRSHFSEGCVTSITSVSIRVVYRGCDFCGWDGPPLQGIADQPGALRSTLVRE